MQLFDDRFEKLQLLGEGTFGEVWKVRDTYTNVVEALKIYTKAANLGLKDESIFTHEFKLLAGILHPNLLVPSHYSKSRQEGYPYIHLKFCDSGNITKIVGKFDERRAWQLLHDIAGALAFLYGQKPPIIHQDIKPENILLDDGKFMLSDFGVSTSVSTSDAKTDNIEEELRSAGTIAYMAPERFSPKSRPIMANDIWSLGATMFEMLTGTLPFGNDGGLRQSPDTPLPQISGDFSDELKQTIYDCLSYKTKVRPKASELEAEASEMLQRIDNPLYAGTVPVVNGDEPEEETVTDQEQPQVDNGQQADDYSKTVRLDAPADDDGIGATVRLDAPADSDGIGETVRIDTPADSDGIGATVAMGPSDGPVGTSAASVEPESPTEPEPLVYKDEIFKTADGEKSSKVSLAYLALCAVAGLVVGIVIALFV